jgi:hypothetical protein
VKLAVLTLSLPLLLTAANAHADGSGWQLAAGVGTDFPMDVGARFDVETPFRLRLNTTFGYMPKPYAGAINGFLEGIGVYDDNVGSLIEATLQSSFVWRTHVGYRPFASHGFYVDAGYGLVTLGGSTTSSQIVSAATGQTFPSTETGSTHDFNANLTLHMIDAELGWLFTLLPHWQLRVALGGAFTVGSSTSITPQFTVRSPTATTAFEQYAETFLNQEVRSYAMSPVVSVGTAYAF